MSTGELNTKNEISELGYMLLFRGRDWDEGISDSELQERMNKVTAWFDAVFKTGKVKGGQPLARRGKTVALKNGSVADGPFTESKEAIGGYLTLDMDNLEEALKVAKSCPMLNYGITVEVRPVLDDCPVFKRSRE